MGVHIESAARHPSTIGVAVSTGAGRIVAVRCWFMPTSPSKTCLTPGARYEKILTTPIKAEDLADIRVGDVIYLTGTLVTCRDVCHRRLIELKRPIPLT